MKYKCDMVRDLMPLCLDCEATEASEQVVIEHLAECKECTQYYEALEKDIKPVGEKNTNNKYVLLAAKIRKRRLIAGILIVMFVGIWLFVCLNYADGYRISSKAVAKLNERLNDSSEIIASFEWKDDYHFYIYDSYSCYDIVGVEKTWHGWKKSFSYINCPKWSIYDENIGIEVAGNLCFFEDTEGVQIFSIIVYDEEVETVEVTCFGQTQTKEAALGEVTLFTFEAVHEQKNIVEATAYDEKGNIIYRLENQDNKMSWISVTE